MTWRTKDVGRLSLVARAIRTPLLILVALWIVCDRNVRTSIVLLATYYGPPEGHQRFADWRPDYWWYSGNVALLLASVLAAFALVEIKRRVLPRNRSVATDAATIAASVALALIPAVLSTNVAPTRRQLLIMAAGVTALAAFLVCNSGLWLFQRHVAGTAWFRRLVNLTFPVSDIAFYTFERERFGSSRLRLVPTTSYIAGAAIGLLVELSILVPGLKAQPVPVGVAGPYAVIYQPNGFWFTNNTATDPRSGIWYYEEESGTAKPYIRILDPERFKLVDGAFYFYDKFDSVVQKVDVTTRDAIWQVPVAESGTYQVVMDGDLIVAAGETGNVAVMTTDGVVRVERRLPFRVEHPQILRDGRLVFLSGDPSLRIWNQSLTEGERVPLPLPDGVVNLQYGGGRGRHMITTVWSAYDEQSNVVYVAATWGDVFRYDVTRRSWLTTIPTSFGLRSIAIDREHGLLFAANYYRGFIEVIDIESRNRLRYIVAKPMARFIDLDPTRTIGTVSTKGYGMYRFNYSEIVRRAAAAAR